MPERGEIKKGDKSCPFHKYIWAACIDCGKERWVRLVYGTMMSKRCLSCAKKADGKARGNKQRGSLNKNWKGGRFTRSGIVMQQVLPEDFFYPMAGKDGYVKEHRLVMAKHLGRCLQPWEIVHHKGKRYSDIRNKSDNLTDNLELSLNGSHSLAHSKGYKDGYTKGYLDGKAEAIRDLKEEICKTCPSVERN